MKFSAGDRVEEIFKKVNIDKLPFKINPEKLNELGIDIADDLKNIFSGLNMSPALRWCLSTIKKAKVFTLIYEANELGLPIYKEEISKKLPEYSYKTISQIVEEGIEKKIFINLAARTKEKTDSKIRNIRPSEEVIIEFVNQQIDLLCSIMKFKKYE